MKKRFAAAIMVGAAVVMVLPTTSLSAKTRRTLHTEEEVRRAREKVQQYDWARAELERHRSTAAWLLEMPDEELWNYIPGAAELRNCSGTASTATGIPPRVRSRTLRAGSPRFTG